MDSSTNLAFNGRLSEPGPLDASYKLLFSYPEVVRDLVTGFIPDDWLHNLDYATLEKVPGNYVTDDLRARADDVIWRVRADGKWVYLYLLIEFQSQVDFWMPIRIMTYVGLLYQDLIRRNDVLPGKQLPPVLPVVLYNGSNRWTAETDIGNMIPRAPGMVGGYLPKLKYLLIDENTYTDEQLSQAKNLVAAIIRIGHPASNKALFNLIDLLNEWLADNPDLRRVFAIWIRTVAMRQSKYQLVLPKVHDLKELKMTLAERFEEWAQQYEEQGIAKGLEQGIEQGVIRGEALVLQKLLAKRFGVLPDTLLLQISTATRQQLDTWVDRVLEAENLEDVFRN